MIDLRSYKWFCRFSKINKTSEDGIVEYNFTDIYEKLCNKFPKAKIMYIIHDKDKKNIHAHFIIQNNTQIRKSTLINVVKYGSLQKQKGSNQECYNYLMHKNIDNKEPYSEESIILNFKEELEDWLKKGKSIANEYDEMINDLYSGFSPSELRKKYPKSYFKYHKSIKEVSLELLSEKSNKFRNVNVIYIYGESRTYKTRTIIDYCNENKYTYYRVTDYDRDPFENYYDEKVLILDEYRANFTLSNFLTYLEGYSKTTLPSRYSNKFALYDIVFIISNIPLSNQYQNIDEASKKAIKNRIKYIAYFSNESINLYKDNILIKTYPNVFYQNNKGVLS